MTDTTSPALSDYGLGTGLYIVGDKTVFGHNGKSVGFAAALRPDPMTGLTVVVLTNDQTAPTEAFANRLVLEASAS